MSISVRKALSALMMSTLLEFSKTRPVGWWMASGLLAQASMHSETESKHWEPQEHRWA